MLENPSDNGELTIKLFCTDLKTRADGDDAYNENQVFHFDYFFFADAEGTTPLYPHARVTGDNKTFATDRGQEFELLREGGYVYVVANYPDPIPENVQTLEQVLKLPVSTDFQADYATKNENGFIMDNLTSEGKITHFSPVGVSDETVVNIALSRLAVKMTLVMNIAKEIAGSGGEVWTPVVDNDHLFVYFVNALSNNTIEDSPSTRETEDATFFTYETSHGYTDNGITNVDGVECYTVTTDPSYTYPQSWAAGENGDPYYKIQLGWNSNLTGMSPFYYKIPIPVSATEGVFTLNRNTWYQLTLNVKVLGGTKDDFVFLEKLYCVADFADWSSPSSAFGTTSDSAEYFDVPTLSYDLYSIPNLKINFMSNTSAVAEITEITYYDYSGTGATEVKRNPANGSFSAASASGSYTHPVENRTYSFEVDDDEKVVVFTHDISNLYVVRTIKLRIYKSTESAIYRDVVITQHPAIELKKATDEDDNFIAGDLFVNGYFASVKNSPFGTQYGGYYHYPNDNGWRTLGQIHLVSNNTIEYGNIVFADDIYWIDKPAFTTDVLISAFSSTNNYYNISVDGGAKEKIYYKIGDPRAKARSVFNDWSLNNYVYNNNGSAGTAPWQNPGDILVSSKADNARNIIAPHFLISSGLTEEYSYTGDYNQETVPDEYLPYVKRGATFQEAGYPAGRWRLPTEAEIAFIAARQNDNTLPKIFNVDVPYFAASGRFVIIPSDGSDLLFFSESKLDDYFTYNGYQHKYRELIDAKFIYDLWYWGDSPMSSNVYHPNQHIEN